MSNKTTYFVPLGDGNKLGIDFGDLYSDCFPERMVSRVTFDMIQLKRDKLPEVGSRIVYQNEHYFITKVTSGEEFWSCRKKWTRRKAIMVRNKYRRITVEAR